MTGNDIHTASSQKVKKRISDYLDLDIGELFNVADKIAIFGGAVRDSIANMDIHDVDILCFPKSARKLKDYLEKNTPYTEYKTQPMSAIKNMYKQIHSISEPWTYIWRSAGRPDRIIQIIRPAFSAHTISLKFSHFESSGPDPKILQSSYEELFDHVLSAVDITACGLAYKEPQGIIVTEKGAFEDAMYKRFTTCPYNGMYSQHRTQERARKLTNRGWTMYNP